MDRVGDSLRSIHRGVGGLGYSIASVAASMARPTLHAPKLARREQSRRIEVKMSSLYVGIALRSKEQVRNLRAAVRILSRSVKVVKFPPVGPADKTALFFPDASEFHGPRHDAWQQLIDSPITTP